MSPPPVAPSIFRQLQSLVARTQCGDLLTVLCSLLEDRQHGEPHLTNRSTYRETLFLKMVLSTGVFDIGEASELVGALAAVVTVSSPSLPPSLPPQSCLNVTTNSNFSGCLETVPPSFGLRTPFPHHGRCGAAETLAVCM